MRYNSYDMIIFTIAQKLAVHLNLPHGTKNRKKLECGPMSNVMAALPNIGGALCSSPQTLADAHYQIACSNAAKTQNPLKLGIDCKCET